MHRILTALTVGAVLLKTPFAAADVVSLAPVRDNTLYEDAAGARSNGAGEHFFAGRTGQSGADRRRGLVAFDVAAAVSAGSTIESVTLRLYMSRSRSGARSVEVRRALAASGEGTSDAGGEEGDGAPSTAGDATWLHTFYPDSFWSSPGGDFAATASAALTVSGTGFYSWSTTAMAADVQSWLDDPASDFGWVLVGAETAPGTAKRFDSRENPNTGRRPSLEITFTPPAGPGACCAEDEPCVVLPPAECKAAGGVYLGSGTACDPDPCDLPYGACCFVGGACQAMFETDCLAAGGAFQGDATACDPNPCPAPTGACCFDDGTCAVVRNVDCAGGGGAYEGDGAACTFDLCPVVLEPFVDALPVPAIAQPVKGEVGGAATYEIAMTQFEQRLHRDLPPTTVWGYGGTVPGPTIEASVGEVVHVRWKNELRDESGVYRTDHLLPVDTCPHGAEDAAKTVVHLHGAHVEAIYDGYPEYTYLPGAFDEYVYPNIQFPLTMWYHDHALGITRLNVYLGLAGFYLLRDDYERSLGLPSGEFEVPLAIMDRSVNADGSLRYPETMHDHFFGHQVMVNGRIWPYFEVKAGKYRFRLLNASGSRTYTLSLSTGNPIIQVGSDGGLLPFSVALTEITLAPAERADVIFDFEDHGEGSEVRLENSAPAPYPNGGIEPVTNVMKFVVTGGAAFTDELPFILRSVDRIPEAEAVRERTFELAREADECGSGRWLINGLGWMSITERPRLGDTEIWRFVNHTGLTHPMHMHLVQFQVLDRQAFEVVEGEIVPVGARVPPREEEAGWKDTVQAPPGEITRVIARFEDFLGRFAYHCHILEHEEHEMMRQFETLPACPADIDRNDVVALADLLRVLVGWGPCPSCLEDVDDDGVVGFGDLLEILKAWGPCPE